MQVLRFGSLLAAAVLALGASQAQAAIVTVKYSGTASGYDPQFGGEYGDAPFLMAFTFDETADPAGQGALLAASLTINSATWNVPLAGFTAYDTLVPGGFRATGFDRRGRVDVPEPGTELTFLLINLVSTGTPSLRNTPVEIDGIVYPSPDLRRSGYHIERNYDASPDTVAGGYFYTTHLSVTSEGPNGSTACCLVSSSQSVPEPATWGMLILGFGSIGAMSRRRQRAAVAAKPA